MFHQEFGVKAVDKSLKCVSTIINCVIKNIECDMYEIVITQVLRYVYSENK